MTSNLLQLAPLEFADALKNVPSNTGYVVTRNGKLEGSDKLFTQLATEISTMSDYDKHDGIFFRYDERAECLFIIFVHNTTRGQAQGGTRLKGKGDPATEEKLPGYDTLFDVISDGMRLSRGMTEKNSIAGLWWGGGKAIICPVTNQQYAKAVEKNSAGITKSYLNQDYRSEIFRTYGAFVASLGGIYIAAEDMNTTPDDMLTILSACRYVTCLPPVVGGSDNPSKYTAKGVYNAMRASVKHYMNKESLSGMTVNIQGIGNVGMPLAELLLKDGARINVFDVAEKAAEPLIREFTDQVRIVGRDEIMTLKSDIFAPCSVGGILNSETIPALNCKYVIGAANNQLKETGDYKTLAAKGIVYIPDFFINRMGIVNCANEQYGRLEKDLEREAEDIYIGVQQLLKDSDATSRPPQEIALEQAAEGAKVPHLIWPGRTAQLINKYISKQTEIRTGKL